MPEFKGKRSVKDIMSGVHGNVSWKRKRMNNTVEYALDDGTRCIRLHDTDIIKFMPNGDIVLNSGGYQTRTTKDRLNAFLDIGRVYQDKRIWYLYLYDFNSSPKYVFQDGITITKDRQVRNAGHGTRLINRKKDIDAYVNAYCEKLFNYELPQPSAGDCWFCSMVTVDTGKPWGEVSHDSEHLLAHMREKYYVPSLVVNACKAIGVSKAAYWCLQDFFKPGPHDEVWYEGVGQQQIKRALRRYFYSQLGMAK